MSRAPYLPWYPGDFKADTADLSLIEQAAYRNLIDHLWSHEGTAENDQNRLLAASGLAADWTVSAPKKKQILSKILSYFDQKQGQISHNKITELADKAREISKIRAEAGRKGGRSKPKQKVPSKPSIYIYTPFWQENNLENEIAAHIKMRADLRPKAPLNETAEKLLITALKKLQADGHSMTDALERATANSWKSVHAPKEQSRGNQKRTTTGQRLETPADRVKAASHTL